MHVTTAGLKSEFVYFYAFQRRLIVLLVISHEIAPIPAQLLESSPSIMFRAEFTQPVHIL